MDTVLDERPRVLGFMPAEVSGLINRHVVAAHAQDAAFLWSRRQRAARASHYTLAHLDRLDARLLAHLRGLQVAGEVGLQLAWQALADAGAAELFVAAWLACQAADGTRLRQALQLAQTEPALRPGLVSALAWTPPRRLWPLAEQLHVSSVAAHRLLAWQAWGRQRRAPEAAWAAGFADADAQVRVHVCLAAGLCGRVDAVLALQARLRLDGAVCVRVQAAQALAQLGQPDAAQALLHLLDACAPAACPQAWLAAARTLPVAEGRELVKRLLRNPAQTGLALQAAAVLGDPAAMPWALSLLDDPDWAAEAGAMLALVCGLDLSEPGWHLDEPPPTASPQALDAAEGAAQPWPDAARLRHWWGQQAVHLTSGQPYLAGRLRQVAADMQHVLQHGTQPQRAEAARVLASQVPGRLVWPVRSRTDWQRAGVFVARPSSGGG